MLKYKISFNGKQVTYAFNNLKNSPNMSRTIMSLIGELVVRETNVNYLSGQVLKRKTGTLAKSITYRLTSDKSVEVGTNVTYAAIHEFGGTIVPVNASALHFKIADQWITTKKVTMPARPYLYPAITAVLESPDTQGQIERQMQKNIDEEFKG